MTMTPITPPAASGDALRDLLHVRLGGLRAPGCASSSHEPNDELVVMSSTIPGRASTKSLKLPASGDSRSSVKTIAERDEPEDQRRRAGAPAEREVALHQAHDGLEHEREEQRQEERHDRFPDVDERPGEADDGRDEEHRPHREVDAQRARAPGRRIGAWESRLRHARKPTLRPGRPDDRAT